MSNRSSPPSVARGLLAIVWPFLCIVALLVLLALLSMDTLSAARAFVGGESLWSKAQKQAVHHLGSYARSGDEADFRRFEEAIAVPLGDRSARLELDRDETDLALVRQGFVRGGNDPRDVAGMIDLYQRFRHFGPVAQAIEIWAVADDHLLELVRLGHQMPEAHRAGDTERLQELLSRAHVVDQRLTPLEEQFSAALGEASRQARWLLLLFTLLAASLTTLGVLLTRKLVISGNRMAAALVFGEQRLQEAIAASDHGIWDLDVASGQIHLSAHFMAALGYPDWQAEIDPPGFLALLHPDDRKRIERVLNAQFGAADNGEVEFRLRAAGGAHRWVRANGSVVRDAAGMPTRLTGAISDVTERKAAQMQLFAEKERAQVTLESIGDAVITTDSRGVVDYLNPVAAALVGHTVETARGLPIASVCRFAEESSRRALPHPIDTGLREGRGARLGAGALLLRADGVEVAIDASAAPICGRDASVLGMVLVLRDVSRERAAAANLSHQAAHDPMTGLINRREFERRVALALDATRGAQQRHAMLYLDLDQFKIVNDSCGHASGDELLRQVGTLLKSRLRASDSLGRLGGDEFGVLLDNCPPEHALNVAEQLRQAVVDYRFASGQRSFTIGVSVGLVNLDDSFFDLAAVLNAADSACYVAKESGRNRVQIYHPSDSELALRHGMMQWVTRVHEALDEGRLCLYAQTIVRARAPQDRRLHVELLLRLVERDGRLVPPMAFLPAAERFDLMPTIDRWVLRTAFEALARLEPGSVGTCAINLSGSSLCDDTFLDYVRAEHRRCGVAPSTICFEISETAVISNLTKAAHFIDELRRLGFRFSLDDFGGGMSSFGYLKQLRVDYLKIDGEVVRDMLSDPIDGAMVEAINHIGHVMGMKTIAEFVETDALAERLREIGVDYLQGHAIGRPMPFEALCGAARALPVATA